MMRQIARRAKKRINIVAGQIACAVGRHRLRRADPPRNAWGYQVHVCTRGCTGDWARERHGHQVIEFKLRPLNRATT